MKIGLLSYRSHPYSGGQGIYIKHLSKALSDIGHDVSVLSGPPYPELDNSVELIEIPSLGLFETEDRMKAFSLDLLLNPRFLSYHSHSFSLVLLFDRLKEECIQAMKAHIEPREECRLLLRHALNLNHL